MIEARAEAIELTLPRKRGREVRCDAANIRLCRLADLQLFWAAIEQHFTIVFGQCLFRLRSVVDRMSDPYVDLV